MNSKLIAALAATTAMFALSACGEPQRNSAINLPPGKYENKTTSVDATGTKVEKKTTTEVYEDMSGDKTAVVKTKTTHDPRGLFNKSSTTQTEIVEED